MKTIIEIIVATVINIIGISFLVLYEMIFGQGSLIYFFSKYYSYVGISFVLLCGLIIFILFENKQDSTLRKQISIIFLLAAAMILFIMYFPFYSTDEFIYNTLKSPIINIWKTVNTSIKQSELEDGIIGLFVKYIYLDEEKVIVPFTSVILSKVILVIKLLKENCKR